MIGKKKNILLSLEEYETLKETSQKSAEYFDKLLRLQADFDNYKKRSEKDRIDFINSPPIGAA